MSSVSLINYVEFFERTYTYFYYLVTYVRSHATNYLLETPDQMIGKRN